MDSLLTICAYLNIQGFAHKKLTRVRELGWVTKNSATPQNFHVHPGTLPFNDNAARVSFMHEKYRVHGLDFYPNDRFVPHHEVRQIISDLYQGASRYGCDVVAYKGGVLEKKILDELGIPSINLDAVVPKFSDFPDVNFYKRFDCGKHAYCNLGWHFCSSCRVMYYRDYVSMYCI